MFAGEYAVRTRNGLHQRVITDRLVEIHRGAAWRVEAREPHGADEDEAQRVFRVFELFVEGWFFLVHSLSMGDDVEAKLLHLRDLVLTWGNNQRHVSRLEYFQPLP